MTTLRGPAWLALVLLLAACTPAAVSSPRPTVELASPGRIASDTGLEPARNAPGPASESVPGQYRAWMEEARSLYPYSEPVEAMESVMLCESGGEADARAGPYYGLFQYTLETWVGEWNPYRHEPILDPRAQILATAKAWADGYQVWWAGCLP